MPTQGLALDPQLHSQPRPNTDRVKATTEWLPYARQESHERLFIQTNNAKMERMFPAQSLRCDIVRPMSDNLGKSSTDNAVTKFDPMLAIKLNRPSGSTSFEGKKRCVRNFTWHY
jgi:hypothetical protein